MKNPIFTPEQLAEIYRCIHETLESAYPITDARRALLEAASRKIESAVPDLERRVSESNQEEYELALDIQSLKNTE